MLIHYGSELGVRHARKHLGAYLALHCPRTPPDLRTAIMAGRDPGAVTAALREAFGHFFEAAASVGVCEAA
jgi:hypothetical protein